MLSPRKRHCNSSGEPSSTTGSASDSGADRGSSNGQRESYRNVQTLASKDHSKRVLVGLESLRKEGTLCDYTLVAEGETVKVHRAVMVACSDYFRVMLTGEMKEAKDTQVNLQGVSYAGLQAAVEFAYTGKLELSLDNVEETLSAASHLQMCEVVDLCCDYLEGALTNDNCVDILNLAEMYTLQSTMTKAKGFMLENFEVLADMDEYYKLNQTQLCSILTEDSLRVMSEYRLFERVLQWIEKDPEKHEAYTAELMKHVRLPLLTGEELVEKVSQVDLMKQNQECNELLNQAKDYHIVISKQPLLQNPRTRVRSHIPSLVMCHGQNIEGHNFAPNQSLVLAPNQSLVLGNDLNVPFSDKNIGSFKEAVIPMKDAVIPLYNPCVCVIDNFMYACGGKYDSNVHNEIATARCFRYDPRFDTWFELASMTEARKDFVMLSIGKCLYAIGGQDENILISSVECFQVARNEWESRTPLSNALYCGAGAECNGTLYVSGGQQFDGFTNKLMAYDPESSQWSAKSPMLMPRGNHIMEAVHGRLFVLGGNTEDAYGFSNPVEPIEMYNPETDQWTRCQNQSHLLIREAGSCIFESRIYIVGGIDGDHYYTDKIYCYDPTKDEINLGGVFGTRIYGRACCIMTLPQYM